MQSLVLSELWLVSEALPALGALGRFLSPVDALVAVKGGVPTESLPTLGTAVGLLW